MEKDIKKIYHVGVNLPGPKIHVPHILLLMLVNKVLHHLEYHLEK